MSYSVCRSGGKMCDGCMKCQEYHVRIIYPKCSCCEKTIKDDYLYDVTDITGERLCEDCFKEFINDNFKQPTDRYIKEE